ncbi:hypothetical protein ACFXGI_27740 [Streptomyces sp. NPDC059355]|uniref:hypothetical protein n=1 Tax=Streptomyces sp. NPDC059355 TaxID=3346811 RepID=UPI0036736C42
MLKADPADISTSRSGSDNSSTRSDPSPPAYNSGSYRSRSPSVSSPGGSAAASGGSAATSDGGSSAHDK